MVNILRQRVTYAGGLLVGPAVSTLHWLGTGNLASDAATIQTRTFNFLEAIKSHFAGGSTWAVKGQVDVIDMVTGDLVNSITIADMNSGGSASGEPLPPANQAHVRLETGAIVRSRRFRGHWYIPNVAEAVSNGQWNGSQTALINGAKAAFIGSGILPVVYSRPVGPHGAVRGGSYSSVTDMIGVTKFAILRSRRD